MPENDAGSAKLVGDTKCSLTNVQYWGDITLMYGVDSNGEPLEEQDSTDMDFRCYVCLDCDNNFDSFEEVKEHL